MEISPMKINFHLKKTIRLQIAFFIFFLFALIALNGCSTKKAYSGPDLTPDKIAIIQPDTSKAFTEIRIKTIDEYDVAFYEESVAVWPGNHKMLIEVKTDFPYLRDALGFSQNVSFNVEAGYVYTVHAKIDSVNNEGFLWVTSDKEPEQYVGGTKIGPIDLLTANP